MTHDIEVYNPSDRPLFRSIGEWTILWWNWALSIPKRINPVVDKSGEYAHIGQPPDVWFLAGRFGSEDKSFPHRRCTIPYGTPILLPVLNCEANQLEYPYLRNELDLINHVSDDIDTVVKKDCLINGEPLPLMRIQSDPQIFSLKICNENGMEIERSGVTKAAADGYWVFMKPPPRGKYRLQFHGSCEAGKLAAGAIYDVTIL